MRKWMYMPIAIAVSVLVYWGISELILMITWWLH